MTPRVFNHHDVKVLSDSPRLLVSDPQRLTELSCHRDSDRTVRTRSESQYSRDCKNQLEFSGRTARPLGTRSHWLTDPVPRTYGPSPRYLRVTVPARGHFYLTEKKLFRLMGAFYNPLNLIQSLRIYIYLFMIRMTCRRPAHVCGRNSGQLNRMAVLIWIPAVLCSLVVESHH